MEERKKINGEMLTLDEAAEKNERLTWSIVNRFRKQASFKGIETEDLFSIASIGLVKAYQKFDPETYDVRFSTYAVPMMIGEIQRYFRDNNGDLKFSRPQVELAIKIQKDQMENEPIEKICLHFDEDEVIVKNALYIIFQGKAGSLSHVVNQGEREELTLEDQIGNNNYADYTEAHVKEFFDSLEPRDRLMMKLLMEGKKQSEIGKAIGTTQVQVSRLIRNLHGYVEQFFGYPIGYFQNRPNISVQEGEKKMKDKVRKQKSRTDRGDMALMKELLSTTKKKVGAISKQTGVSEPTVYYWAKKLREPQAEEAPVTISHIEPITIEKTVEEVQDKIQEIGEQIFSAMGVSEEVLKEEPQFANVPEIEFDKLLESRINAHKAAEEQEAFEKHLAEVKEQEDKEHQLMEETDQFFTYAAQKEGINPSEINTIFKRVGHVAATSGLKKLNVSIAVSTEKLPNLRGVY